MLRVIVLHCSRKYYSNLLAMVCQYLLSVFLLRFNLTTVFVLLRNSIYREKVVRRPTITSLADQSARRTSADVAPGTERDAGARFFSKDAVSDGSPDSGETFFAAFKGAGGGSAIQSRAFRKHGPKPFTGVLGIPVRSAESEYRKNESENSRRFVNISLA